MKTLLIKYYHLRLNYLSEFFFMFVLLSILTCLGLIYHQNRLNRLFQNILCDDNYLRNYKWCK